MRDLLSKRNLFRLFKFLRNHPEVFQVDDKRVRLIEQMDVDEIENVDMECETPTTNLDEHWFCFDDSMVTCVSQQHIQRHFGLSECAYMLFYRLKTPSKSNSTAYSIPQWLIDEIAEKNKALDEKRYNKSICFLF